MSTSIPIWQQLRRDIDELPTHPAVAHRIINVAGDGQAVSNRDLEEAILHDPVKTASILRLANSELFGKRGRIATIGHAVSLIDPHLVRITSLHFSFTHDPSQKPSSSRCCYWQRSWLKSLIARRLASYFPAIGSDEARVAGLLADIGSLILATSVIDHDSVSPQTERDHRSSLESEQKRFGMCRYDVSGKVFEEWHFPEFLCAAVRVHHQEDFGVSLTDRARELAKVLHLAEAIIRLPIRNDLKHDTTEMEKLTSRFVGWTGLATGEANRVMSAVIEMSRETNPAFEETSHQVDRLRERARLALFQVGLSTAQALSASTKQMQEIERQTEELRRQRDRLKEQVALDPLLGIANRRHFDVRLEEEFKRCMRNGQPLSLILFDLDHFKQVNDTYLHQAGDEVLKSVTRLMRKCLRSSDVLARYGGEEFGVICPETDQEGAISLAERMRQSLECLEIRHRDYVLHMTASFGVATIEDARDVRGPDDLVDVADHHLFESKRSGRNQVRHGLCPDPTRVFRGSTGKIYSAD
ncbi:GGDEF domain-containing protein [bacterium]|nr:GGDEF domain-containing protein [bacterium]